MTTQLHPSALPAGHRLQEYEIVSVLGVGGFGITYLANDTQLEMRVAIKEYLPNSLAVRGGDSTVLPKSQTDAEDYRWGLDRFMKEAQTLARFRHPNIVRVLRFFEANGTGYTVMEYEEGQSLGQYLAANPPAMGEAELLRLLLPLLDGLKLVHAAGFLHRDIKPANIYLRADGSPVLIDFGSARQAMGSHTQSITSIFTPGYAPFEQYFADGKQGPWTDIYALAAVAYRLVAGMPPPEAAKRVREDTLLPATTLCRGRYSAGLLHAIDQALAMHEAARPQSIDAWLALLNAPRTAAPTAPTPAPTAAASAPPDAATVALRTTQRNTAAPASVRPRARPQVQPRQKRSALGTVALIVIIAVLAGGLLRHLKQRKAQAAATLTTAVPPTAHTPARTLDAMAPPPAPTRQPDAAPAPADNPPLPREQAYAEESSTPQPQGAAPSGETPEQRFARADSNHDGYLSPDEVAASFPRISRIFDRVDLNHDGRLSAEELARFAELQRRREFATRR